MCQFHIESLNIDTDWQMTGIWFCSHQKHTFWPISALFTYDLSGMFLYILFNAAYNFFSFPDFQAILCWGMCCIVCIFIIFMDHFRNEHSINRHTKASIHNTGICTWDWRHQYIISVYAPETDRQFIFYFFGGNMFVEYSQDTRYSWALLFTTGKSLYVYSKIPL